LFLLKSALPLTVPPSSFPENPIQSASLALVQKLQFWKLFRQIAARRLGKLSGVWLGGVFLLAGDGDAQGAKEVEIVLGEGLLSAVLANGNFALLSRFGNDVVEADGGFEHQQHVEAVLADVLDHAGDLLTLDDRLVDGLA
jgi:hypothetical protein